jgi:hypothetical protein
MRRLELARGTRRGPASSEDLDSSRRRTAAARADRAGRIFWCGAFYDFGASRGDHDRCVVARRASTAAFFAASPTKNERFQALIATIFCHDDWTISTVF